MELEQEISLLWHLLPHIKVPGGGETVIRWMAKKRGNVVGDFVDSERDLLKAVKTFYGWDFYVAPNPTLKKIGTRHTAADVTHWSWLLLDVDPQERSYDAHAAMCEVLDLLTEETQQPILPLIIDSGRGEQAWLRLSDLGCSHWCGTCADNDPEQPRREIQVTMRYWLKRISDQVGMSHGCKLDTTTSDLPRVMRCPGTVNSKTGKTARLHSKGKVHEKLGHILMDLVPKEEFKLAISSQISLGGRRWQFAFPHLTETAKTFILEGTQEPGRHTTMWHTAKKLTELELEEPEIKAALEYGNYSCRNGLGEKAPLSARDVQHSIDTARSKAYTRSLYVRPGRVITIGGDSGQ